MQKSQDKANTLPTLLVSAVGIVFGDIGTSPLYTLRETFAGHHPIALTPDNIMGVLSLLFWTVMILISLKYVIIMMRADNQGEGGSLALLALVTQLARRTRASYFAALLGIFAAALFYGDSMITPAISVLSAVEGLSVVTTHAQPFILPLTMVILTALFALQRQGTGRVGLLFGPIMCLWFLTLAVLGIIAIIQQPQVLAAFNPSYAIHFIQYNPWQAFLSLGTVVLAVTGGEALYTDMGHFGKFPLRLAWFFLVLPALLLNYFGQGALLLHDPAAIESPFYHLAPDWGMFPLVILATLATVIASQAVISGAFSVARQAIQLGYLPRMTIIQTSSQAKGQIYIPFTNWSIYLAVMALVIGFQSSSNLAAAYGVAVTGTMLIDTLLVCLVMLLWWRWHWLVVAILIGGFLTIDIAFFASTLSKIPEGGWFPLALAAASFTVLTTWKRGRQLLAKSLADQHLPLVDFIPIIDDTIHRVEGTAVFMTSNPDRIPAALLHNLKHNKVIHKRVVVTTILTVEQPRVSYENRLELQDMGKGFYRLLIRYGFMEHPHLLHALQRCKDLGLNMDTIGTSFFVNRETIIPSARPGMALWREMLFTWLSKQAVPATDFFRIPINQVIELGTQIAI